MIGTGLTISECAVRTRRQTPNLATRPAIVNPPWVDNGDGTYSIDGSQSSNVTLFCGGLLEAGTRYRVALEVLSVTSAGTLRAISHPESGSFGSVSSVGLKTVDFEAGSINFNVNADPDGFAGTVRLRSIRAIPS
ncbi:hypothetical protein [Ruegeria arenilitoris]|uniref:hypothetical protein n=1 Tax=Ruegeria arenilitoris TaxID=1173585 RepID=UPI00147E3DC0|nr:hypothetical protein [Ruegeria arenilitoris]